MDWFIIVSLIILFLLNLVQFFQALRSTRGDREFELLKQKVEMTSEKMEKAIREESRSTREDISQHARQDREERSRSSRELRDEIVQVVKSLNDSILKMISEMSAAQKNQSKDLISELGKLTESNEKRIEGLRVAIEEKLRFLQEDNSKQLEKMRETVDEKLQGTLEKRLGESFKQVSERLEQVYRGLGEMQLLANGVGDLKKVLTNVKTRGTWGEVQLGSLLEQLLTEDQFQRNVKTKSGSNEIVEFAIKLPGRGEGSQDIVWLPVDSKFPMEDYERLIEAQQQGDVAKVEQVGKMLESQIKKNAKDIGGKYLSPPETTDFAIMFLPTEGLYAEVTHRRGLVDFVQNECRVVIAGPTTFAALLNALQMGFRTVAIEKRSSEVWKLLGAVKTEFGKFGSVLDNVKKKLNQASNSIESAAVRSRAIERTLRKVEELPTSDSSLLLDEMEEEFPQNDIIDEEA